MHGKLATVIDRIEHGHHVFRAYFKHAFLKQYEKFATFLRNELVSNNLADFHLKKGLVKIHDPRVIRLLEILLHGGSQVGGWTAKQIHHAVLTTFQLSDRTYGLNQLRYDLRKLKAHGLLQRDGSCYAYRLTPKGVHVALLFLFFHKRLCGPLANSRFHHCPDTHPQAGQQPRSRLPSRRQSHSTDRRSPRRLTFPRQLLNSFCRRFSELESRELGLINAQTRALMVQLDEGK